MNWLVHFFEWWGSTVWSKQHEELDHNAYLCYDLLGHSFH